LENRQSFFGKPIVQNLVGHFLAPKSAIFWSQRLIQKLEPKSWSYWGYFVQILESKRRIKRLPILLAE